MVGEVATLKKLLDRDQLAESISNLYNSWESQRAIWLAEQTEKRDYLFATDTTKTTNSTLPWKNSTTRPKLTQLMDNLHANYISSMFSNPNWFRWIAFSEEAATKEKRLAIEAYMSNKVRQSNFRTTISRLLLDYIIYGNAIADVIYVNESKTDEESGEEIPGYVGPKAVRVSPLDIVFNPTASDFTKTPKIRRLIKTFGELEKDLEENPEAGWIAEALAQSKHIRNQSGGFSEQDFHKAVGFTIDGFGNLQSYFGSPFVEILELSGDVFDPDANVLLKDQVITVIDRSFVVRKQTMPTWLPNGTMHHVGWRLRTDNLYAMGPLDNLVGMQYRIDHLENLKADVFDLIAFPPLKILGDVKEFSWGPGEEIFIDEGGSVDMLVPDTTALNADLQISILEQEMEEFAGAPKQAMGIRTPGEKTAFEVQALDNAAGRIFQEKIENFEINLVEPILNAMLEVARRNINGTDVARVMDDDLGVEEFLKVTKEDITAAGKLRPVGSRHFAAQAQLTQNLLGIFNSPVGQMITPHISKKKLALLVEEMFKLERFDLVQENVGIAEDLDAQRLIQQGLEDVEVEGMTEGPDEFTESQ